MGKLHAEAQIFAKEGSWHATVTLSQDEHTWTSNPMKLDADNYDDAQEETAVQVTRLLAILGHQLPPSARQERYQWQEGDIRRVAK